MKPMATTVPNRYTHLHSSPPDGPGDARPTALQILKDNELLDNARLTNKVFLVTGGTSGLGLETVRALARTGARAYFTARDEEKGQATKAEITAGQPNAKVECLKMDLASFASVRTGAAELLKKTERLNVLVANAGIGSVPFALTEDEHESQFQVNYLSHFLLLTLLKPLLLKSSTPDFHSRVIAVSSISHRQTSVHLGDYDLRKAGYDPMLAYAQSKTAMIWMTAELSRRYSSLGLHGLALHPGVCERPSWQDVDSVLRDKMKPVIESKWFRKTMKSPEQAAATVLYAAIDKDLEGMDGLYLENCGPSEALEEGAPMTIGHGYAPHAFDEAEAGRLWQDSFKLVGVE